VSRRKLRPEELDLWRQVARTTDRLHPENPRPRKQFIDHTDNAEEDAPRPVPKFRIGEAQESRSERKDVLPGLPDRIATAPVYMDRKAFDRLRRGKLKPEARIDLHGMTQEQAQPALTAFIMTSHARGRRLVLVITGKGRRSEEEGPIPVWHGILRNAVPAWLRAPPLSRIVLQVTEAHARHGGIGAYYVYLRRKR